MNNMQLIAQLISSYKMMMKNGILIEVYRTHALIMTIKKKSNAIKIPILHKCYLFIFECKIYNN